MTIRIQPSILSADFVNFESEFQTISGADGVHVDVMDGHFVPNLTFGLPMVKRMREISDLPLDVHLMIEDPDFWAAKYADSGVFSVTVHLEACNDPIKISHDIHSLGVRAGIAIKPGTSVSLLSDLIKHFDQVLVMSVEPGFGGQSFISNSVEKIAETRKMIEDQGLTTWLQVDGGIDEETIASASRAGADTFVAGSSVFKHVDRNAQIENLRSIAVEASRSL